MARPAIRGPEPCPVRGDYHQWAFLERVAGMIEPASPGRYASQGPDRLMFYCQFCLVIRPWNELVSLGRDGG